MYVEVAYSWVLVIFVDFLNQNRDPLRKAVGFL